MGGALWWQHSRDERLSTIIDGQREDLRDAREKIDEHDQKISDTREAVETEQQVNVKQEEELRELRTRIETAEEALGHTKRALDETIEKIKQSEGRIADLEALGLRVQELAAQYETGLLERDSLRRRVEELEREDTTVERRLKRIEEQLGILPEPID